MRRPLVLIALFVLAGCSALPPAISPDAPPPPEVSAVPPSVALAPVPAAPAASQAAPAAKPVKIGLALGGGAAKGFAHVGVIKALESHGIVPDVIAGTSAGSVVGALYASGMSAAQLEKAALALTEDQVNDWGLPDRGVIKGEALQNLVNRSVGNRPLEQLARPLGVVATDLRTGERLVFRTGNTGMAVRASSAVPGVFKPVSILGRDYVDGGLTSPVPVTAAREMGADLVIAVDISAQPAHGKTRSAFDVLMQTFTIMGQSIGRYETAAADVLIRPPLGALSAIDFTARERAIAAGEKAAQAAIAAIKGKLEALRAPATVVRP